MWRSLSLVCLALALSDPLLRQWEAASDLALSLAELSLEENLNNIEPLDGGVGDDPGTAILRADGQRPDIHGSLAMLGVPAALLPPFLLIVTPPKPNVRSRSDRPPWQVGSPCQQRAWLQRYLI